MFDQFKTMGALAGLMKDKERLKQAAERVREKLEATRVEGEAGGGAVRVTVSGTAKVLDVTVAPAVASAFGDEANRAAAEQLIAEATNDGLAKARGAAQQIVEHEAHDLGLGEMLPQLRGLMP